MKIGFACELRTSTTPTFPPLAYPFHELIYWTRASAHPDPSVLVGVTEENLLEKLRAVATTSCWLLGRQDVTVDREMTFPDEFSGPGYRLAVYRDGYRFHEVALMDISQAWTCVSLDYNLWSIGSELPLWSALTLTYPGHSNYSEVLTRVEHRTDPASLGLTAFCLNAIGAHESLQHRCFPEIQVHEGAYHAAFFLADSMEKTQRLEKAMWWYFSAHQMRPARLEPLYRLAQLCRRQGLTQVAREVLNFGTAVDLPMTDYGFVDESIYGERYIAEKIRLSPDPESLKAVDRALRNSGLSESLRRTYTAVLADTSFQLPTSEMRTLPAQLAPSEYRPLNPSVVPYEDGYVVNVRHTNYYLHEGKYSRFVMLDGSRIFKTRNFLYWYDRNWELRRVKELEDDFNLYEGKNVWGVEDLRLFTGQGRVWALADSKFSTPTNQIYLVSYDETTMRIHPPQHLPFNRNPYALEKNWLPFDGTDSTFRVVYTHQPLTVLTCSYDGHILNLQQHPCSHCLGDFRGSAAPIPYRGGYLGVVHNTYQSTEMHYVHRFVHYDNEMRILRYTLPFYLCVQGVEFVAGLAPSHDQTGVYLSFGVQDREARICKVSYETLLTCPWVEAK